jgi:hypothetical protein
MAKWKPISDRPPPMTKTELREMLAQAVRNTAQPAKPPRKVARIDHEPTH